MTSPALKPETPLFEYPFQSHYATVDGVRIHYLDEGQGPVIWLMHGNTSWSYLYRKMIPNHADHPHASYVDQIRKELEHWNLPVLVVWPDGDMAWKTDEGARIAQLLPDAEFYLVHNAGHFLQEDAGEEVALRMVRFLDERFQA